jgi:hypothetical protein
MIQIQIAYNIMHVDISNGSCFLSAHCQCGRGMGLSFQVAPPTPAARAAARSLGAILALCWALLLAAV